MDRIEIYKDLPADGLATPYGHLYRPQSQGKQILALIAAFAVSMSFGGWTAAVPGDLSTAATVALHIPYVLVFFLGYGLWVARINAIVFDTIGRSVLKVLWHLIVHRKQPDAKEPRGKRAHSQRVHASARERRSQRVGAIRLGRRQALARVEE
jgi:hypothetical protein